MYKNKERIWELDLIRGIALVLMIYFHVVYDLKEIFHQSVSYQSGINYYLGKVSGSLFIFAAGLSSSLAKSNTKRALKLLAIALAITAATHLYDPQIGIKFGILHFLGLSILAAPLFLKLNKFYLLLLGTAVIILSPYLSAVRVNNDLLFVFGLTTNSFVSSDFYPLFPWFGVFLYGLSAGKGLYRNKKSLIALKPRENLLTLAGRHTLLIYLLHQPLILVILNLIF